MMTSKPKRKAPPANFLTRLWRELLFTREFYYEVDASPEACAEAIREQLTYKGGCLSGRKQEVLVHTMATDRYGFKLEVKRPKHIGDRIIAIINGTIEYDETLQRTIVSGEAEFDATNQVNILLPLGFFSLPILTIEEPNHKIAWFLGVAMFFGPLFWLWFGDRQQMVQSLDKTLRSIQSQTYEKAKVAQPEAFNPQEKISGRNTSHKAN